MKTKIFLSSVLFIAALFFTGTVYSQHSGCEKTGSSCCSTKEECTHDAMGNAGGDSAVTGLTCIVSGEEIGEGQGVNFDYYGKTYTFCCDGCVAKFKKEPLNYIKEEINCPVMGEPVDKDVFAMHNGTKYYMCCKSCLKKFESDPEKYMNGGEKEEHKH